MVATVYIPNGIAIVLLFILIVSANNVSRNMMMLDSKIFYLMVICNLMQCVGEIVTYAIDGRMIFGFHVLSLIANSLLFIINIFFAYLWVVYADYRIYEDLERIRKFALKMMIPALIVIVSSIVNLFTPVFFRITADNQYQRTALFVIPYLVTYFYLVYGTVFIYRNKEQAKKYVFLPAILFMMPILMGSAIQFFSYGISTVWVGVAIALVSVYVNVQNEASYIDALSGLFTRLYMYKYLESLIHKHDKKKKIIGIMLDIDDFKKINDNYGHLVGDDAIHAAGKILYEAFSSCGIAARYGGDEFIGLQVARSEDEVNGILERIKKAEDAFNETGREYELHFSMGYGVLDMEKDTVDSFLKRIDSSMYEAKKKHKSEK